MKKRIFPVLFCFAAILAGGVVLPGCGNGIDYENFVYPPAETREGLGELVESCSELLAASETGTQKGQYPQHVYNNFQAAIGDAKAVFLNSKATQEMVDTAQKKLERDKGVFLGSVNADDVDPNDGNLVLHLRFSNNTLDSSPKGHRAVLNPGNALSGNGPQPYFTEDRYGNANGAMRFEKGGYISIPYVDGRSESLNPEIMTFMCWIKESDPPAPVQRWLFCLDTWNIFYIVMPAGGSEFQFGGQTTRGWIDPIMGSGIYASPNWTHLAVTYSPSGAAFYKNGELVRQYPGTGNLVRNNAKAPFLIGIMHPERELYFDGVMDEFRLYDKILTADEVFAVFNMEKPENMAVDRTELGAAIDEADTEKSGAVIGFNTGEYLQSVVDGFSDSIAQAASVMENTAVTQNQVDKAVKDLEAAIEVFRGSANTRDYEPDITLMFSFDGGVAVDGSYNSHKPQLVNGVNGLPPYPAIDRYGNYDGAFHFDRGSYISVPFHESLNPEELTYMFWIKAAEPAGVNNPYLMSINRRFALYIGLSGNHIVYGGSGTGGTISEISPGVSVGAQWKHIALAYSATDGIKMYENGLPVRTDPSKGAVSRVTNRTPFVIGVKGSTDNTTSYFKGDLDEICFYDRALGDAEILNIYNQQKP